MMNSGFWLNRSLRVTLRVVVTAGTSGVDTVDLDFGPDAGSRLADSLRERLPVIAKHLDLASILDRCLAPADAPLMSLRATAVLTWAVPGRGFQVLELDLSRADHQTLADVAQDVARSDVDVPLDGLDIDDSSRLVLLESGIIVRDSGQPSRCTLDLDLWTFDAPPVDGAAELPAPGAMKSAYESGDTFVVANERGVALPVRLDARLRDAWRGVCDKHEPAEVERRRLAAAGLLHRSSDQPLASFVRESADFLREHAYVVLPGLVSAFHSERIRHYWLALADAGWLMNEEPQRARLGKHREPTMELLHAAIEPTISSIVERDFGPCKRTYSFLGVYQRGAVLRRHKDRPQCRWNVSLCFGSRPAEARWPIFVETVAGPRQVLLQPGDAILYSGTELFHGRDHFFSGELHGVCFFHFVDRAHDGFLS